MKRSVIGLMVIAFGLALAVATGRAAEPASPFNGKDLTGWKAKGQNSFWTVGTARLNPADPKTFVVEPGGSELVNAKEKGVDFYSEFQHGDAVITLEVMVPQGSNSGIYVMGEYEVQVLDSAGKDANPGPGDMGAIYGAQPPTKPTYRQPGEWNQYEIRWLAPRFDAAGKKTANAKFLKVVLNGAVIHENVEMPGPTPGGVDGKEKAKGPLMFQGNHGAVAYRNIRIKVAE